MIKKNGDKWKVDLRPNGRAGKRVQRSFNTKAEAKRFESHVMAESANGKEWNPKPADNRRLSDLITEWHASHGQFIKSAEKRKRDLENICERLGDPIARNLTPKHYTDERTQRIAKGITPKTCNNELGYINAVYNELKRTQIIDYENPLSSVRPIKIAERELSYLEADQIRELLDTIKSYNTVNPHVYMITKVSLATGARWTEAESLTPERVKPYRVTFVDTKSKKNRTVPITKELYEELHAHFAEHGNFTKHSMSSFRRALAKTTIDLPKGQAAHALRHTFASHFIMQGGNILTLQKILGHASVTMTMRYAHLSPDHLEEAAKLNPLSLI